MFIQLAVGRLATKLLEKTQNNLFLLLALLELLLVIIAEKCMCVCISAIWQLP